MIPDITPVSQIDWERAGARFYHVPFTLDHTWGRVRVPLYVACSSRPGPTIVAIGGTHGDEYEGPVGLKNLIRELDPARLAAGRLIVIPVLNVPAFRAARRDSPLDGQNMNRVFPGVAGGTITQRIARFVTDEVLARADVVIDLHAGGAGFEIIRCMSFHQVSDPARYAEFRETALLFGTPFVMIYTGGMGTGAADRGSGGDGQDHHRQRAWFRRVDRSRRRPLGASRGPSTCCAAMASSTNPRSLSRHLGLDRQRVVSATDIDRYVTAPVSGISEPLVPIGAFVSQGQPVARIHDFERIDEPPVEIRADGDGYVMCRKFRAATDQGEVVMVIAAEVD
jgi:predicted deacylase